MLYKKSGLRQRAPLLCDTVPHERAKCHQEARVGRVCSWVQELQCLLKGKGRAPGEPAQHWWQEWEIRKYSSWLASHWGPGDVYHQVCRGRWIMAFASTKKPSGCIAALWISRVGTVLLPRIHCDKHTEMKSCSACRRIMSLSRYLS